MEKASKHNNWHYNPNLQERAVYLRKHFTKAESYMWKFILKGSAMGYPFKRQRPVLNYIADFMCCELNFIVECDGATHLLPGAEEKDLERQRVLESAGFCVLRFEDSMVLNHLSATTTIVEQEINKLKNT